MQAPKKSLGQHWLHDKSVLESIAEAANLDPGDQVLEIGPGLGTLTDVLLAHGAKVSALEFDQDLMVGLLAKYGGRPGVEIIKGDIRKFDLTKLPDNYKIVANIPYYLTSHLVRLLAETPNKPKVAVLLIQKEVADRICAKPGQMSLLSVVAQWQFDCSLGPIVPANLFTPPPKVDSQVVILKAKSLPEMVDEKAFLRIVKAGFSERRKTLGNSLHGGLQIPKDKAVHLLEQAGIEPTRRAQTLSLDEWLTLYKAAAETL